MTTARALWYVRQGEAALRPAGIGKGVLVETIFSGISRGTEKLVFEGRVPVAEHARMRCPGQEGAFSYPVKYGYCAVGRVMEGELAGRAVFALHPHQTSFRATPDGLNPLPEGLPPERAVLAANMETALNILWDSGLGAGDRVLVIGGGVVGLLTAYLAARHPGVEVTVMEINPDREGLVETLGCAFAGPDGAVPRDCDVVINTSASATGLDLALERAGMEARVVEASWHGAGQTPVTLGGAFHSRRLRLVSSQVGHLPAERRARWSYARRMSKALELLLDPVLDHLISGESTFENLPHDYGLVLSDPATLCHRIRYVQP